jgi:cleavage and polyadenylation specificity factor subunit 2
LTHATTSHIAAFAHCCKHFPLFTRIPIYATTPVASLGRTLLQDLYASSPLASTVLPKGALSERSYPHSSSQEQSDSNILLQPPTAEEIAGYFSLIHPLKYSQPHQPLSLPNLPPLNGLTITAYGAGHTLGGTIWHIQHGLESIVYAADWNQARENVLSGAAWLGGVGGGGAEVIEQLRKPTALICSAKGVGQAALRTKRDEALLDLIRETVANGGTVLIPTDSSARVLELAYILEHSWRAANLSKGGNENPLRRAKLYLASRNIGATMRYARSMLEWMDESMEREFDIDGGESSQKQQQNRGPGRGANGTDDQPQSKSGGPFDFRHLKLLERKGQIDRVMRNAEKRESEGSGQVILASDTSLEWGFSRDILKKIASNRRNLVILTESMLGKSDPYSQQSIGQVLSTWLARDNPDQNSDSGINRRISSCNGRELTIKDAIREPLDSNEVYLYQQYLATQRKLQNTMRATDNEPLATVDMMDDDLSSSSSSSDESDTQQQGKALNISKALTQSSKHKIGLSEEDLGINILLKGKGIHDFDVRGRKPRDRIFPFVNKRKKIDDFGEAIRPEEYLRAEERDELNERALGVSNDQQSMIVDVGKKRKWDDGMKSSGQSSNTTASTKRRRPSTENTSRLRQNGTRGSSTMDDGLDDSSDSEEEHDGDKLTASPSRLKYVLSKIEVHLRVAFVDFSGIHDRRSVLNLIPLIKPRKLILIAGDESETMSLSDACRKLSSSEWTGGSIDILLPKSGETVKASVDTNAWAVKLSEGLVRGLEWQDVRGLSVVHVMGKLALASTPEPSELSESTKKQKLDSGGGSQVAKKDQTVDGRGTANTLPSLDVLPSTSTLALRPVARSLHVGDIRLADLRKLLQSSGHLAEFRGEGTLLVDGMVAVRKSGTGKIEVEGGGLFQESVNDRTRNSEGTFYVVRKKIYEGLALVAAG